VAIIAIDIEIAIEIAASNKRLDFDPDPDFDFEDLGQFDAASILDPSANIRSLRTV